MRSETLIGAGAIIMKDTKAKEVYLPDRAEAVREVERRDRVVSRRLAAARPPASGTSSAPWAATHAALPVVEPLDGTRFALYLSLRDATAALESAGTTWPWRDAPGWRRSRTRRSSTSAHSAHSTTAA